MTYAASVTINTAALLPKLADFMADLNETMRGFGVQETVTARSEVGTFTIQAEKELTHAQLEEVRAKAEKIARDSQPNFEFRFGRLELQ